MWLPTYVQSKANRREQERREERQKMRADAGGVLDPLDDEGSFDDGDPYTTDLYIGMTYTPHCKLVRSALSHDHGCGSSQCLLSQPCCHQPVILSEHVKAALLSATLVLGLAACLSAAVINSDM